MEEEFAQSAGEQGGVVGARDWTRRAFLGRMLLAASALATVPGVVLAEGSARRGPPDLAFLRRRVHFRPRSEWGPAPINLKRLSRADVYYRVTVHHQGCVARNLSSERAAALAVQNVQDGHLRRRFGDIGYHLVIDPVGRAWEGRSLRYAGAHVSDENSGNLGIMLLGNFEEQRPTELQLECLNLVVRSVLQAFPIQPRQVYGHRDLGQTLCPGRHLYAQVDRLRRDLRRS